MKVSMISILSTHDILTGNVLSKKLFLISMLSNGVGYFRGDMPHIGSLRWSGAYKKVLWAGISLMDSIDTLSCSECHVWPCRKSRIQGWQGHGCHCCGKTHRHSFCLCLYIDGLAQNCSNSSALAMELLQSCTEPSIWSSPIQGGIMYWV